MTHWTDDRGITHHIPVYQRPAPITVTSTSDRCVTNPCPPPRVQMHPCSGEKPLVWGRPFGGVPMVLASARG